MSTGLPMVTTDFPTMNEWIEDDKETHDYENQTYDDPWKKEDCTQCVA